MKTKLWGMVFFGACMLGGMVPLGANLAPKPVAASSGPHFHGKVVPLAPLIASRRVKVEASAYSVGALAS